MNEPWPFHQGERGKKAQNLDIFLVKDRHALEVFAQEEGWQILDLPFSPKLIETLSEQDARLLRLGTSQSSQKLAWRVVRILARRYSPDWEMPEAVLAEALFFPIWAELCTLLTCRLVARHFAAQENARYLIRLSSRDIFCFKYWQENEAAGLFLAYEMKRRGAQVALVQTRLDGGEVVTVTFSIAPTSKPSMQVYPVRPSSVQTSLILPSGIRGADAVPAAVKACRVRLNWLGASVFGTLSEMWRKPVSLDFVRIEHERRPMRYSALLPQSLALDVVEDLWAGVLKTAWHKALKLVQRRKAAKAFVCDHHFFASAVIAGAVKAHGGHVTLLPHSLSPVHLKSRVSSSFDAVVAVTRAGAAQWRQAFPDKSVSVQSATMLPPGRRTASFDKEMPLTIVIIGGAQTLSALPVMKIATHVDGYRRVFHGLARVGPAVRTIFKPKRGWEDEEWLKREVVGEKSPVTVEQRSISEIDYSNMLFVSFTYASSALLEGINRGIPAMVISDQVVENYVPLNGSVIPTVPASAAVDFMRRLTIAPKYEAFAAAQIGWFESELYGDDFKTTSACI